MGMLGNVYLDQGRNDLALEQFERANQVDPGNQRAEFFRARGLFVSGRFQEAESILNSLLQTPSPDAIARESALLSLANVEISLGHLDYARQLLDQVERSNDKFPQLHWAQGVLYQRQGLLTQALTAYEKEVDVTGDELARQRAASVAKMIQAQSAGSSQGRGR
jgi:tetratricopeptide (TPR) repeat protein